MSFTTLHLLALIVSAALALALTPLVRALARRVGMVAKPKSDRWHKKPTAMLGGVAIWLSVVVGYFLFVPSNPYSGRILLAITFWAIVFPKYHRTTNHVATNDNKIVNTMTSFKGVVTLI